MKNIACVILAAGYSKRFGTNKMTHMINSRQTLLEATMARYLPVFERLTVVLRGDETDLHRLATEPSVSLVLVAQAELGMSHSLKAGVMENQQCDGWLIGLGDMPYVQTSTIKALAEVAQRSSIVVPVRAGKRGNPVVFGADYLSDLLQLSGDRGGKAILRKYPQQVLEIAVQDCGIFQDIDTPGQILSAGGKVTD